MQINIGSVTYSASEELNYLCLYLKINSLFPHKIHKIHIISSNMNNITKNISEKPI